MITPEPIAGGDVAALARVLSESAPDTIDGTLEREFCCDFVQKPIEVDRTRRSGRSGFTLTEVLVVVFIIGLLSAIAISKIIDSLEKARLARCMLELRGIQEVVWDAYTENGVFLDPATFWQVKWGGRRPGPYYYLVDGDANKGHGNDLDGIDEDNPGASGDKRKGKDIKFVVLCQHDHKHLADYVYVVDNEPPVVADSDNQPGYERFIKWEFGGPGNGGGGSSGGNGK